MKNIEHYLELGTLLDDNNQAPQVTINTWLFVVVVIATSSPCVQSSLLKAKKTICSLKTVVCDEWLEQVTCLKSIRSFSHYEN